MSNDLTTQSSVSEFSPVKWTAKTSKGEVVKQAYCETSAAFAPKTVRVAEAQQRDLQSLLNGRYVNVLRAVASKMSDKEKVRLFEAGVSVNRDKPTKADMVPFADAVVQMWAPAKGEKAAIAAMLKVFTETVTKAVAAPAREVNLENLLEQA